MSNTLGISVFRPQGKPVASVVMVHGMSEHRKRYDEFAQFLAKQGIGVVTYDQPGHGETAKDQTLGYFGDKDGWDTLIFTAHEVMKKCKEEFPGVPFFLFGHSMGTIVARTFIKKYDDEIQGLILSGAPNFQSAVPTGLVLAKSIAGIKGKKGHSKLLDKMTMGSFNKGIANPRTGFDWLSYNTDNVNAYIADPLCGFSFTNQGYVDMMSGMVSMHDYKTYQCKNPALPILFIAGAEDPCKGGEEGLADSIDTLKKAGYSHIDRIVYDHMRHEILHEDQREKVYQDVADFMKKNLNA